MNDYNTCITNMAKIVTLYNKPTAGTIYVEYVHVWKVPLMLTHIRSIPKRSAYNTKKLLTRKILNIIGPIIKTNN